ncbi:MAG: hypothetical protein WC915_06515 [archaeon]|jgi:hypothetical protein
MKEKEYNPKEKNKRKKQLLVLTMGIIFVSIFLLSSNIFLSADPVGPSSITSVSNETKGTTPAGLFNISGGYIAALNLTANVQNSRWKAFVGWINGKFTLDDAGGATIYDWSLSVTTGRVYSTRDSSTIEWDTIGCADSDTNLESENVAMFHINNSGDNITQTFKESETHDSFWVAGTNIGANTCPTLNTYIGNVSQDDDFEEMALYDGTSVIYATILENDLAGYDGQTYDFQMLVPENGSQSFVGATAYYLYVEID